MSTADGDDVKMESGGVAAATPEKKAKDVNAPRSAASLGKHSAPSDSQKNDCAFSDDDAGPGETRKDASKRTVWAALTETADASDVEPPKKQTRKTAAQKTCPLPP
eukprot:8092053-Pyramimonas_sp.AAC.1